MKFGFCAPNYGSIASRDVLQKSTQKAEDLGYDSVWLTDHILMSNGSGTPYENIFETITTLAFLAGCTNKIRLGISSLVLPIRNPIVAAKQIANLDVLSNGRAVLCVSAGWNGREYEFLGSNFKDRGRRLDESISLMRGLWSGAPSFRGQIITQRFEESLLQPRPVQEHIPIWIGGLSVKAMKRAAEQGDAWHPNAHPLEAFEDMVNRFRSFPGAKMKDVCVRICFNSKLEKTRFIDSDSRERVALCSNKGATKELLSEFERLGVNYLVVVPGALPFYAGELFESDAARVLADLERFAQLVM